MATSGWAPDTSPDVLFSVRNGRPAIDAPADNRERFSAYALRELRIDGMSRRIAPDELCGWISPAAGIAARELSKLISGSHVRVADLTPGGPANDKPSRKGANPILDGVQIGATEDGADWLEVITKCDVQSRWSSRGLITAGTVVGHVHPGNVLSNQQIKTLIEKNLLRCDVSTAQTATI